MQLFKISINRMIRCEQIGPGAHRMISSISQIQNGFAGSNVSLLKICWICVSFNDHAKYENYITDLHFHYDSLGVQRNVRHHPMLHQHLIQLAVTQQDAHDIPKPAEQPNHLCEFFRRNLRSSFALKPTRISLPMNSSHQFEHLRWICCSKLGLTSFAATKLWTVRQLIADFIRNCVMGSKESGTMSFRNSESKFAWK